MLNTYHVLLDLKEIDKNICSDDTFILKILINSAKSINANIISYSRYRFGHNSPEGCTVFVMLDESHISAHTYADKGKISIDVFTCNGREKCESAAAYIIDKFQTSNFSIKTVERFT